jgi:hypothetical protein
LIFGVIGVGHAAVYRANGRTLWFFVKAYTFGALAGNYIVKLVGIGFLRIGGINLAAVFQLNFGKLGAVLPVPVNPAFVNGGVGAFGFASSAVYALLRN